MLPLTLDINPEGYQYHMMRDSDPAFAAFREKIFKRDDYTCQYCAFQAHIDMAVLNVNGQYGQGHNKVNNMVCACVICAQCQFLEHADTFGGGTLIHLPQISQEKINALCHVLFCAIINHTAYAATATSKYYQLCAEGEKLEQAWGEGFSKPEVLTRAIMQYGDLDHEKKNQLLASRRLVPSMQGFMPYLDRWAKAALEELAEEETQQQATS